MTPTLDDIRTRESQYVLQTYRRQPVAFVRGNGARLYDTSGREYLDFVSGIGVASLGHGHPGLAAAIADQASTLLHTSNLYYHPFQAEAASRLAALSGLPRTFFCNSGTEAVEACLKFARRFWYTQGAAGRTEFVAMEGAFSGRTFGALSVTHDEHYRAPFAPLLPGVTFVDPEEPGSARRSRDGADRRNHRGADSGRGRHPAPVGRDGRGHQRGVRAHRDAVHRRRSAERARTNGISVLLAGARPEARSD
jgi:acetylornithine aminotransferase/acetylornithine/N-succinyldiaminopimelate aminotransferase